MSGRDEWPCDQSKPCETIWRAVNLASTGDYIYLNGKNTDKDPYTCQSGMSEHPGIYVNRSLSLIGFGSTMPQIQCSESTRLVFNGSDSGQEMNVTLSGLVLVESDVILQDTSADISRCTFEASKHGIKFEITSSIATSIQISNSTFSKNAQCVSVVVNGVKEAEQNMHVSLRLTDSTFSGNVLRNDSSCLSFTESSDNYREVFGDISFENVTFKHNKFSSEGLVFVKLSGGNQKINFLRVSSFNNVLLSGSEDIETEYIIQCAVAIIFIHSSDYKYWTSYNLRTFTINASSLLLEVFNSTFLGHHSRYSTGKTVGGIVLYGRSFCKINISESSFVNTSADYGGAISIECLRVFSITLQNSKFNGNVARPQSGGAVYLNLAGLNSSVAKQSSSLREDADLRDRQQVTQLFEININKCNFSNAYAETSGGAVYIKAVKGSIHVIKSRFSSCFAHWIGGGAIWITADSASHKQRSDDKVALTVENSTFSDNSVLYNGAAVYLEANKVKLAIFRELIMIRNAAHKGTGSALYSPYLSTCKIYKSWFLNNKGSVLYLRATRVIEVYDSIFEDNDAISAFPGTYAHSGAALNIGVSASLLIMNTTFKKCKAMQLGGAVFLLTTNNASLKIRKSLFVENYHFYFDQNPFSNGGAIFITQMQGRPQGFKRKNKRPIDKCGLIQETWNLLVEDTVFVKNAAPVGGAIYMNLPGSEIHFKNCTFKDNFASFEGGHIYARSGDLNIENSIFLETCSGLHQAKCTEGSFLYAESLNALTLNNTLMDAISSSHRNASGGVHRIMLIRNIPRGNYVTEKTRLNCPVGSSMNVLQFKVPLDISTMNSYETLEFTCSKCPENSYSLQRGLARGTQILPGFRCLPCPFGANCSDNIIAQPNFWGFKQQDNPPILKFTMCPLGYCRSPSRKTSSHTEYNDCQGNRSGELCGHCRDTFTETLYSSSCRSSDKCNDYWFWPLALAFVSLMASYFTFSPPAVSWIYRQIVWYKVHESSNLEDNNKGYSNIVFYFYQAANLLVITSSKEYVKIEIIEVMVGLFNFQQKISASGFICPLSGLTAVTKEFLHLSYVFATLLMICVFYIFHWVVQKSRRQEPPCFGPYVGGILRTLLLGYATLASVLFSVLRCIPIGKESRLFLDANIICFQAWQYVLIAFDLSFIVPFVLVLCWGSSMLFNKKISVGNFLLAVCFPLPLLLYWIYVAFHRARDAASDVPSSNDTLRNCVERVLSGPFKKPEHGSKLSLSWEGVMVGRRLILILVKTYVSDPMLSLLFMCFFCVLFLLHHTMTEPFRDDVANRLETISLLSLVILALMNTFFASFISLAVPLNDHFTSWWNMFQLGQIVILLALPAVFGILLVVALASQVARFFYAVCHALYRLFRSVCFNWFGSTNSDETRPILAQPASKSVVL